MKTNAEILEELEGWETEIHPTKTFQAVPLFISEIYTLMDRARAEERKKHTNTGKEIECMTTCPHCHQPAITKLPRAKPKITREQVEELAYCLHELRRSWNGNSHGKIKWDNSVKDRYEILAKECIEAMGLEVEEK